MKSPSTAALLTCLLAFASAGFGGEAKSDKVLPVLAADRALLARVAALGDNTALLLGKPKITGELNAEARRRKLDKNGPSGRDFSLKMAWAPDRRRGLFCGGAYGSPINDVWEYDLPSNTWVCLYAPDLPPRKIPKSELLIKDGMLQTRRGGPPHASHTWWGMTYDPNMRALLWVIAKHRLAGTVRANGFDWSKIYKGPQLWAYFPYERKWKHQTAKCPWMDKDRNAYICVVLEYIPDLKASLMKSKRTSAYDGAKMEWRDLKTPGPKPPGESVAFYDTKNKLLVAHRGNLPRTKGRKGPGYKKTYHYDLKKNAWKLVLDKPHSDETLPLAHDASAMSYYDPVGGVGLLWDKKTNTLWSYDAAKTKWTRLKPQGAALPTLARHDRSIAYFDEARNCFVILGKAGTWVYRHKREKSAKGEGEKAGK